MAGRGRLLATLALAGLGCHGTPERVPPAATVAFAVESLPAAAEARVEVTPDSLPAIPDAVKAVDLAPAPYRALTESQVVPMAAAASDVATALERETRIDTPRRTLRNSPREEAEAFRNALLHHSAREVRNRSIASALEAYYKLAEAEAGRVLLKAIEDEMTEAIGKAEKAEQAGLAARSQTEELSRKRLDLRLTRVQTYNAVEQLNALLRALMKLRGDDTARLLPSDFPPVSAEPIDEARAVGAALKWRPDLAALRVAERDMTENTLPIVRAMLGGFNALLGITGGEPVRGLIALLGWCEGDNELESRRAQVTQLRIEREYQVAAEVRSAIRTLSTQLARIDLARGKLEKRAAQLKDVELQASKGLAGFPTVLAARTEWLQARLDLTREVMAWHRARVELKKAQGVLVEEAGPSGGCR